MGIVIFASSADGIAYLALPREESLGGYSYCRDLLYCSIAGNNVRLRAPLAL